MKVHHNYTELTEEISRHFKDKAAMRKKIVPFTRSIPMPQIRAYQTRCHDHQTKKNENPGVG
jgi:hypothetical protein